MEPPGMNGSALVQREVLEVFSMAEAGNAHLISAVKSLELREESRGRQAVIKKIPVCNDVYLKQGARHQKMQNGVDGDKTLAGGCRLCVGWVECLGKEVSGIDRNLLKPCERELKLGEEMSFIALHPGSLVDLASQANFFHCFKVIC